ncbi:quinon protein alcohol dehydrogenase-like superfamily [Pisolithus marmoratus]|nr:quinon protein alcohol dehydrogenase-like superfamily [Pisolithus marmoratus]
MMVVNRNELSISQSQSMVNAVAFVDESQAVGGDENGYICQWKIEDRQQWALTVQASGIIWSLAVSQDGRWIVSGDHGNKVIVWNAVTDEKVLEITEHTHQVFSVDIASDCTKIASMDGDSTQIFSITSGLRLLPLLRHPTVVSIKFSPDGSRFATASDFNSFHVYNTHTGNTLFDSGPNGSIHSPWSITLLVWSFNGQQLFVGTIGKITCFDLSKSSSSIWSIHETQSWASIVSNGSFIACSAGSSVSLWDCMSHKQIGSTITHNTEISSVALSPSGGYLTCGLKGGKIIMHNLRDVLPPENFYHHLPLVQVSDETLESWSQNDPTNTERLEPRSHMKDAKESLQVQPSSVGHIMMAMALLSQGDREGALCTFDHSFHNCEPRDIRFLLLLKSILVFESGNQEEVIACVEYLAKRADNDDDEGTTYLYTWILGVMYMKEGNYGRAIPLIERAKDLAPKDEQCPSLKMISLIFGWSFNGLDTVAQQHLCETLYAEECTDEVLEILLNIIKTSDEEILGSKATVACIADFTKKCMMTLDPVDGGAFGSVKHDHAITQYSTVLSLSRLFVMQSRARAAKGLWEDALEDTNEACSESGLLLPWGYEAKHVALHAVKQYDEAINAFESMLQTIEQSHNPVIRQLRKSYISPSETIAAIDSTWLPL